MKEGNTQQALICHQNCLFRLADQCEDHFIGQIDSYNPILDGHNTHKLPGTGRHSEVLGRTI